MHILFLTDNFPPEVNAPASRTFEHCREWVTAGCQVTVVTTAPNFPKGELLAGYKNKIWQSEQVDGVRVIRVWSYISANQGFIRRTLDYVSFMVSAILAASFVRRPDVIIATSPQFFTAVAGFCVGAIKRRPWVFELRDLWPEAILAVGAMKDGWAYRMLVRLENFLYRRAAAIVCVTHAFRRELIGRGIDPQKISIVTNGADMAQFSRRPRSPALSARYGLEGRFVAGYVGTHGMAHGLETVIKAASLLASDPEAKNIRIILLGEGAEKQRLVERASGLHNIIFLDSVPKAEVADHWAMLDVSIIHLRKGELFKKVIPSKLFKSMAMGLPVILGVEGKSADIVHNDGVGLLVEPENAGALADAIKLVASDKQLHSTLAARCIGAARKYDRHELANEMLDNLKDVSAGRALSRATTIAAES